MTIVLSLSPFRIDTLLLELELELLELLELELELELEDEQDRRRRHLRGMRRHLRRGGQVDEELELEDEDELEEQSKNSPHSLELDSLHSSSSHFSSLHLLNSHHFQAHTADTSPRMPQHFSRELKHVQIPLFTPEQAPVQID